MKVKIVGGHGGVTKGSFSTSYLVNDDLLIDAGSVCHGLTYKEQELINYILISHPHLDHIKDLAFLCDNFFAKPVPMNVYLHKTSHEAIKAHLFNDKIWPDFTRLPSPEKPTIIFNEVSELQVFEIGSYKITPIHVNHPLDSMGFIVEQGDKSLVFTQDTRDTDKIWEISNQMANVKGIFTEISFTNSLEAVAQASFHHTPNSFKEELKKIQHNVPIYVGHLKPIAQDQLVKEIHAIGDSRIHILKNDGVVFSF